MNKKEVTCREREKKNDNVVSDLERDRIITEREEVTDLKKKEAEKKN